MESYEKVISNFLEFFPKYQKINIQKENVLPFFPAISSPLEKLTLIGKEALTILRKVG